LLKNIFLDAGGIILNENNFENNMAKIITNIIKEIYPKYSLEDYWKDVDEAVYRFVPRVYDYVLYKHIKNIDDFKASKIRKNIEESKNLKNNFELVDGIKEFLIVFSQYYKIGILGQYGKSFKNYLEKENVLKYFTYSEVQDDYKVTKPDPRYFEAILKKCNCEAYESIMVGDRIDKDIIPAKQVGMKTIRIRVGIHKNQEPRLLEELPDMTVKSIGEIKIEDIKTLEYGIISENK